MADVTAPSAGTAEGGSRRVDASRSAPTGSIWAGSTPC